MIVAALRDVYPDRGQPRRSIAFDDPRCDDRMRRTVEAVDHHDHLVADPERSDPSGTDLRLGQRFEELVVQLAPVRCGDPERRGEHASLVATAFVTEIERIAQQLVRWDPRLASPRKTHWLIHRPDRTGRADVPDRATKPASRQRSGAPAFPASATARAATNLSAAPDELGQRALDRRRRLLALVKQRRRRSRRRYWLPSRGATPSA